jgi:hypothetical protein
MALTYDQKVKIAWADWVGGITSASLGPISFGVAAATSLCFYNSQNWSMVPPTADPIPSQSDDQGVLHNALVSNYLTQIYKPFDYTSIINMACQVRPNLTLEIQSTPKSHYDRIVNTAICLDLSTVQNQMTVLSGYISFNALDLSTVTNVFIALTQVTTPNDWATTVNNLISQVANFDLSHSDKSLFTGSLQILRSSFVYWSSGS